MYLNYKIQMITVENWNEKLYQVNVMLISVIIKLNVRQEQQKAHILIYGLACKHLCCADSKFQLLHELFFPWTTDGYFVPVSSLARKPRRESVITLISAAILNPINYRQRRKIEWHWRISLYFKTSFRRCTFCGEKNENSTMICL